MTTATIEKLCADHLRSACNNLASGKLRSCHAHEIVAAYFGYNTAAALQADGKYPLANLDEAEILIPDLRAMDKRVQQLSGLPAGIPTVDELASKITGFLRGKDYFLGNVWMTRDLDEYIDDSFAEDHGMTIEDDLSSEMAVTNAYFDEVYVEEVNLSLGVDTLVANVSGSLNGENDPDLVYHGDSINFRTVMTFQRVAGRVAFLRPELKTSGAVDLSAFDGEDTA